MTVITHRSELQSEEKTGSVTRKPGYLTSRFLSALLLAFIACAGLSAGVYAAGNDSINVPRNYSTIQGAIDAASDGMTIIVAPGVYYENINFLGKNITVQSSDGPAVTTIDGGGIDAVVTFGTGNHTGSYTVEGTLDGFTVTNGYGYDSAKGGGIEMRGLKSSSPYTWIRINPVIRNCIITGNHSDFFGGGIRTWFYSSPVIEDTEISYNTATYGGGVGVYGSSHPDFINTVIKGNTASIRGGAMRVSWYSVPGFVDSEIIDNTSGGTGGAVNAMSVGWPYFNRVELRNNHAMTDGGAIHIYSNGEAVIRNSLIAENTANRGGGIFLQEFPARDQYLNMRNSTVANNTAQEAGGIYLSPTNLTSSIWGSIVWHNNPPSILDVPFSAGYSDLEGYGADPVQGIIDEDPLFEDMANGNYRLGDFSPAIDTGIPWGGGLDLDGKERPIGPRNDMGAYEYGNAIPTDPVEAIEALGEQLQEYNLPWGLLRSLQAKLDAAVKALSDAKSKNDKAGSNVLGAFIHEAEAIRGKRLTDEQTNYVILYAKEVISNII